MNSSPQPFGSSFHAQLSRSNAGGALGRSFLRFAIVGLTSNALLFVLYLLLVYFSLTPKSAATVTYAIGVLQTFWVNRVWSFDFSGKARGAFARYCAVYLVGYLINMYLLSLMVDQLGYNHRYVQAIIILGLAVLIFASLRYWVFRASAPFASSP